MVNHLRQLVLLALLADVASFASLARPSASPTRPATSLCWAAVKCNKGKAKPVYASAAVVPEDSASRKITPQTEQDGRRSCRVYTAEGLVDYTTGLEFQKELQRERIEHKVAHKGKPPYSLPDALVLLEHPEVYTLGSSSEASHILFPLDQSKVSEVGGCISVQAEGENGAHFQVHRVQRGGKVTYHCPGQIVGYPIVDLARHQQDIGWYLRTIEAVIISALAEYGVEAQVMDGLTGVWVGESKIAAVGVGASRWVTLHGWALNVDNDMQGFARIVPCGIEDRPVCSLRQILRDDCPSVTQVRGTLQAHFMSAFALEAEPTPLPALDV